MSEHTAPTPTPVDKEINLRQIFSLLKRERKLFIKVLAIAFVLASLIILCVPRYYRCSVMLAPELSSGFDVGGLSSLASSFGLDLGGGASSDAIYPELYPDLMESKDFQTSLFSVRVKTLDGEIDTDYYTYLKVHQKSAWWDYLKRMVRRFMKRFKKKEPVYGDGTGGLNPFALSEDENSIAEAISKKVSCHVDVKTYVITISVEDQDKLICATLADTVRVKLQEFITQYRTSKARTDMEYYKQLADAAKKEYEEARLKYSKFSDANRDVVLFSYQTEIEDLSNDMQLKFNTYTAMNTQYEAAKAKVQERTPAFTIVQGASIPVKPAGPKRMLFVIAVIFLTFTVTLVFKLRKVLIEQFNK